MAVAQAVDYGDYTMPADDFDAQGATGSMGEVGEMTATAGFDHTAADFPGFGGGSRLDRLTDEERLEREVIRRRNLDLERRARIFDAKRRTIGVDKDFLNQQVDDKAAKKQAEAAAQRIEDRQFMGVNRMLQLNEKEKNAARFEAEKAAKEYSLKYLNFQSRDVFDLNDPKATTKGVPARVGDLDPRLGPASMQKFNGEDLLKEERDRQMKLATVNQLEQQMFEKKMLQSQGADDGAAYQKQAQDLIDLRNEMEAEESGLRKEIMHAYQADLRQKMEGNAQAKSDEQEMNQHLNQKELDFHSSDPFLQESRPHVLPNGKAMASLYKGSTRDERVENFGDLMMQCQENAMKRAHEGMYDKAHHNHVEMTRRQLVMMEREKQRMRKSMAQDVASHNKGMLQSQKDALAQAGPDGHKNKFHPEFFEQFGVGTR